MTFRGRKMATQALKQYLLQYFINLWLTILWALDVMELNM